MIDYDPHDWRSHLCDVRGSMLKEIAARVSLCVISSAGVTLLWHLAPRFFETRITFPESIHALVGFALGLLLVFRTNASYDRFWEGRKQWGAIVNESRNLARAVAAVVSDEERAARHHLIRLAIVFPWATMNRLRGSAEIAPAESIADLSPDSRTRIASAGHRPLMIARIITERLQALRAAGRIPDILFTSIDANVQSLVDYLGACERIHNTPLPFAYVVHLRRALILYCYTLPLAIVSRFGWMTIPATLAMAYVLFGVEEIGVEIEDPFETGDNDLPLERICATIERDLREILREDDASLVGSEPTAT